MKVHWTRRALLRDGSIAAIALAVGCQSDDGDTIDSVIVDTGTEPSVRLSKEVFVQITGTNRVRLRFETWEDVPLRVTVTDPSGAEVEAVGARSAAMLEYEWNYFEDNPNLDGEGDVAGLHVLHTVELTELMPGEVYRWRIDLGAGVQTEGSFRASPTPEQSFRVGWIADTMAAVTIAPIETLASKSPEIVLHGGDLTYQSHLYDTWVELSRDLVPLTSRAAFMPVVGNHEFESPTEVEEMFDRLYGAAGDSSAHRYFAFTYGCMRYIGYDSESGRQGLDDAVRDQDAWLEGELAAAQADPDIKLIVVGMHRPMFTLSHYWVYDATQRDIRHELFIKYGVNLVFCGHMHGYERFDVDGVVYVVDGGGGALLYDPVGAADMVESARPGEAAKQLAWHKSNGCTIMDVNGDGSWTLQRFEADGGLEVDTAQS